MVMGRPARPPNMRRVSSQTMSDSLIGTGVSGDLRILRAGAVQPYCMPSERALKQPENEGDAGRRCKRRSRQGNV